MTDWNKKLLEAARFGTIADVREALDNGADANSRDHDRQTPLMWVRRYDIIEKCILLIERGADVNAKTYSGFTALKGAVWVDEVEKVKVLLESGADVAIAFPGETITDCAEKNVSRNVIKFLEEDAVKKQAAQTQKAETPLERLRRQRREAPSEPDMWGLLQ